MGSIPADALPFLFILLPCFSLSTVLLFPLFPLFSTSFISPYFLYSLLSFPFSFYFCRQGWPSGLRRQFKVLLSKDAWVRTPLLAFLFFIYIAFLIFPLLAPCAFLLPVIFLFYPSFFPSFIFPFFFPFLSQYYGSLLFSFSLEGVLA